uniref:Dynein heavy chain linker domain-containing protein n=1 Tax=Timema poppense TaxID=170557 RepID=A0A7R9CWX4_TIMPO|nr:unnamed protein product [Timema poppensis]
MSHAVLTTEDIQLNSRVFLWPKDMESVLELSQTRLSHRREMVEQVLRNKRAEFDTKLVAHQKELEVFKRKDPPILTMDEMVDNVETVDYLVKLLQEDKREADAINAEEQLLDFDPSPFLVLQSMLTLIDPLEKLWHTVLNFHKSHEVWYYDSLLLSNDRLKPMSGDWAVTVGFLQESAITSVSIGGNKTTDFTNNNTSNKFLSIFCNVCDLGSFMVLDADEVKDEVEGMFRTLYKLAKTLYDIPGSKRVAEMVRAKVEKFRHFIPVLQIVCNKGLQDRHWKQMSKVVGIPLTPDPQATLSDMIEIGLPKFITKLEEISVAASKEYALERNLRKMKEEWDNIQFECVAYRDTGVEILSAVDDIQVMLDDHILKAQTMRGSPYVKAFETEMQLWEAKLISMQDILDSWLQCQVTWLYLEPIFSSEDIMRQMPDESKKFRTVDKQWRAIMNNTKKDKRVLVATDFKDMLLLLKENNSLLDEIQKGLNDYLEKKRLFFPRQFIIHWIRFFFLSNDELLEILSETKDPQRVQPHLKKCFEGINTLEFTAEQEIVAMVSAEKEVVSFSGTIIPADAKGMVEKWLAQVEEQMVQSMKDTCMEAIQAYFSTAKNKWLLDWPGQIVICAECVHWTAEVAQAIEDSTLPVSTTYHGCKSVRRGEEVEEALAVEVGGERWRLEAL